MSWLDRLEKIWRPYSIKGVTLHLIMGQFVCYALSLSKPEILDAIVLVPARVFEGEIWRLATFLFFPPLSSVPIFLFFAWYLFYLMGDALEPQWGTSRYNRFLLIAYVATVVVSFLTPAFPATNAYIAGSVFLAFAYLFPDFQLMLFFILPVKVKWLAMLTWFGYFFRFAVGPWADRLAVLAAVSNFLLFFGRDILTAMRAGRYRMVRQVEQIKREQQPVHRCVVCGVTDKSEPGMDFRYCSRCADSACYCRD